MLLQYNTSTDENMSVSECISADQVTDFRNLWDAEDMPEVLKDLKPTPGVFFTLQSIESLPGEEIHYDTLYYFCTRKEAEETICDLYSSGKTKLLEAHAITLLNPRLDSIQAAIIAMQDNL